MHPPPGPRPQLPVAVVVPHDMALDAELWRWTPPEATLLIARTGYLDLPVTVAMAAVIGAVDEVVDATRRTLAAAPLVAAYACTAGSFVNGVRGERTLTAAMRAVGVAQALTTSGALVEALHALRVRSVAVVTPYDEQVTDRFCAFLGESDIAVSGVGALGLRAGISKVRYSTTADLVIATDTHEAEAVVVSCTNLTSYDLIEPLEQHLGKPVVTANQATIWAALRRIGVPAVGPGQRLVQTNSTAPEATSAGGRR